MNSGKQQRLDLAREKLVQLYRFLKAFHERRYKVPRRIGDHRWHMWFRDLAVHPSIRVINSDALDAASQQGSDEYTSDGAASARLQDDHTPSDIDDFLLSVRRPDLTDAPSPPEKILSWLEPGWADVDTQPSHKSEREDVPGAGSRPVLFDEDPERVQLWDEWVERRARWVETEQPARRAMDTYERLYALYAELERESESVELVLGDGLLVWQMSDSEFISHPILLQRVELRFDPNVPEFTICEAGTPPELYSPLLNSIPKVTAASVNRIRDDLDGSACHPLGGDVTDSFLDRAVKQLSAQGDFAGKGEPISRMGVPRIGREPVLLLRRRTLGFSRALESILDDLPERETLPSSVLSVVGVAPSFTEDTDEGDERAEEILDTLREETEDALLAKEANQEQIRIVQLLEKYGAVLVQGPPGTGKTHTIANILGHLLAKGKKVLVTSHTARALTEVRSQVIESLRSLCVAVLGTDLESREQLEASVDGITNRLSLANPEAITEEVVALSTTRSQLISKLAEARQNLLHARTDEYRPIVIAGESWSPSDAARRVIDGAHAHGWIPSPVTPGVPLPLTDGEVRDLYRTNSQVASSDEEELSSSLPSAHELMQPQDFAALAEDVCRLRKSDLEEGRDLWQEAVVSSQTPEALLALQAHATEAIRPLVDRHAWQLELIETGLEGGAAESPWEQLFLEVDHARKLAATRRELLIKYAPELPDEYLGDTGRQVLAEILSHLTAGGKLGRLVRVTHGSWRKLIDVARVNGRTPTSNEEFQALQAKIELDAARKSLVVRWGRLVRPLGAPFEVDDSDEPERIAEQACIQLQTYLGWADRTWKPIQEEMEGVGFSWDLALSRVPSRVEKHGQLLRIADAVVDIATPAFGAQINRLRMAEIDAALSSLKQGLRRSAAGRSSSSVVSRLRHAVQELDSAAYGATFDDLARLNALRQVLETRNSLLAKLERNAPGWASAIRERKGIHGQSEPPGSATEAWLWRQMEGELERRAEASLAEIQAQINRLQVELHETTADLIDRMAWLSLARAVTHEQH